MLHTNHNNFAVQLQPQTIATFPHHYQDVSIHRPDSPCGMRQSTPEILQKMRQALDEMKGSPTSSKDSWLL